MANSTDSNRNNLTFIIILTIPVLLMAIGYFFPSYYTWGFSSYSILPPYIPVVAILAGIILSLSLIGISVIEKLNSIVTKSALLITSGIILFLMRSDGLVYGDGFMVLNNYINSTGHLLGFSNNFMKPLDVLLYSSAYKLGSSLTTLAPKTIISIVSVIGGMLGIAALWRLSNILTKHKWDFIFYFLGMLSSGSVLLFFGHIENYTWATSCSLWMLVGTIEYCRGESSIWKMIIFGLLSIGFHVLTIPSKVVILIALIYRQHWFEKLNLTLGKIVFIIFSSVSVVAILFHLFSMPQYFVPIWPLPQVPYWVFSLSHFIDIINETVLVAPFGFSIILILFLLKSNKDLKDNITYTIIGTMSASLFAFSFWLEPKLGAARDWDFLSFYGIPFTLLALYRLRQTLPDSLSKPLLIIVSVVSMICLLPNVLERMSLQRSVEHLDPVLWDSPQHAAEYGHARRTMIWGWVIQTEADRADLAQRHYHRRIESAPDSSASAVAWFGIGSYFYDKNQYDSAVVYLHKAAVLKPENIGYIYKLGLVFSELGRYENAVAAAEYMTFLEPDNERTLFGAGGILLRCNQPEKARSVFFRSYNNNQQNWDVPANIGVSYLQSQKPDSVIFWTQKAISLNKSAPFLYANLIRAYLDLNQRDKANEIFNQYKLLEPDQNKINLIEQLLTKS